MNPCAAHDRANSLSPEVTRSAGSTVARRRADKVSPRAAALVLAAAALTWPRGARAEGRAFQRFFFRMALGGGYGFTSASAIFPIRPEPVVLSYEGGAVLGAFSLGAFVAPGFAVHLDASASALLTPAVAFDGMRYELGTSDFTTSMSMVGAGFTWTHTSNAWVSLAGGVMQISAEFPFERAAGHLLTTFGGAGQLMVGYDRRVAEHWFLGGALHGMVGWVPEAPTDMYGFLSTWFAASVGAVVTIGSR